MRKEILKKVVLFVVVSKVLKLAILWFIFWLSNNSFATEIKKQLVVSASIVYNCQEINEKNKKFCENVDRREEGKYLVIRY